MPVLTQDRPAFHSVFCGCSSVVIRCNGCCSPPMIFQGSEGGSGNQELKLTRKHDGVVDNSGVRLFPKADVITRLVHY